MITLAHYWSEIGDVTLRKIIDEWCLRTRSLGKDLENLDKKEVKVAEKMCNLYFVFFPMCVNDGEEIKKDHSDWICGTHGRIYKAGKMLVGSNRRR